MVEDTQKRYADDVTLQELVRLRVENDKLRDRLARIQHPAQMELPLTFAGYSAPQSLGLVERLRDRNFPIDWQTAHEAADEIERLREALQFYADRKNYDDRLYGQWPKIKDDEGEIARSALQQNESE